MEGLNFMGRADEKPVDIDLEEQENPEKVWCSRQHAVIELDNQKITIEDLNSSNGTFLNRNKIYPGQKMPYKGRRCHPNRQHSDEGVVLSLSKQTFKLKLGYNDCDFKLSKVRKN